MNGSLLLLIVGWIFFGFGALAILSLLQYLGQRGRWRGRAEGTITAIETLAGAVDPAAPRADRTEPLDPTASQYYRPVVRYEVDGKSYDVRGAYLARDRTTRIDYSGGRGTVATEFGSLSFETGQKVPVAYNRSDPGDALLVDRQRELQIVPLQFFIGLICMALGLLVFYGNGNLAWLGPDWHP